MMKIKWIDRVGNEKVLRRVGENRCLLRTLYYLHVFIDLFLTLPSLQSITINKQYVVSQSNEKFKRHICDN